MLSDIWEYWYLSLVIVLFIYVGGLEMASSADLQKLVENMKRAQGITGRAAADAEKHSLIMDNFEKRLDLNHENMSKIEEYDKLMASMEQMGDNGGPALDATFPSTSALPPVGVVSNSTIGVGKHGS